MSLRTEVVMLKSVSEEGCPVWHCHSAEGIVTVIMLGNVTTDVMEMLCDFIVGKAWSITYTGPSSFPTRPASPMCKLCP